MATEKRQPARGVIVIGGSAGAIEGLQQIVGAFPPQFAASVFVVVHLPSDAHSYLPSILTRAGALTALHPSDGDPIRSGHIYVATPDHHMTLAAGKIYMRRGPRENRHRPAIDPLFRTAARSYGRNVIGVILSGNLDDGSAGLYAVRNRGGIGIVQNPEDAQAADMPQGALNYAGADYILPVAQIGPKLVELASAEEVVGMTAKKDKDNGEAEGGRRERDEAAYPDEADGKPSVFACPECHGVLWEIDDGKLLRFECRVGHSYTAASLKEEMNSATEAALWAAVRALEEKAAMSRRLANTASGPKGLVERLQDQAESDAGNADIIRKMIFGRDAA